MTTPPPPSLHDLQSLAARIALRAAAFAAGERERGVNVAAAKSTPTDLVTEADRATEALIRAALADARPGDGFYGEESGRTHSETGLTWVVDPIDGTVNYTYAIPAWAVSIAVVQGPADPARWRTLAGAVVNPTLGELWQARAGGGAELVRYRTGETPQALRLSGVRDLATSLIGTGFAYDAATRVAQARQVLGLIDKVADIRRHGAASLDLVNVAAGRVHAYYEKGLHPYDHAAGALIAREAGAVVHGPGGGREDGELTVAAHPAIAAALDELLRSVGVPA